MSKKKKPLEWTTETRKIDDLVPYEKNPRQMTEKQVEKLRESMEKFNLVEIPAINRDNTVLAGHQRLKIMALMGRQDEEIEVRVPNRLLTEEEAEEYLIRSNKNRGDWDFDMLANEFDAGDLLDFGFEEAELFGSKKKNTDDDKVEPEHEFSEYLSEENNYVVLFFKSDIDWLQAQTHFNLETVKSRRANGKEWSKGVGRVIDGAKYLNSIADEMHNSRQQED